MRRYFINPQLKISSAALLVLVFLFMVITLSVLKQNHDNLKDDYSKTLGAVAARVLEKRPELESEIMPLITREISEEDAEKGGEFLSRYGVSRSLEDKLFPYINKTIERNNLSILLVFVVMGAVFFALNYLQHGLIYEKVRRLTMGAKKVVEGEYDISISEDREGDFSKLALSFNLMRNVIRNNLNELKKEKQFLADLLSDISHQLKTPLSSMIVYNDIMLGKELSREQSLTFLQNNKNQLSRMDYMIKSILKLARLDAKAIELDKENQSLNETILEAVEALEGQAARQGVSLSFNEGTEVTFEHDRLWLEEAFINIIKNGIEHTPAGGSIEIWLYENPVFRRVVIEDTGEGISEEDLHNIFKRFFKAKTSRKSDSIGIGLALAKSIVEAHNGMIEVQSRTGKGTKFVIIFLK